MEASLLLTLLLHPLPPALNSLPALSFDFSPSFSSLLPCARMASNHVVDLFVDRSAFVSKSASFWSDGPDLSKPALYQHCHSLVLVALKGHLVWPVFAFTHTGQCAHIHSEKKFESCTLENISIKRNTSCHKSTLEL